MNGPWRVSRLQPNVLVLDKTRLKFYESPWTEPMGIIGGGPGLSSLPNAQDTIEMAFEKNYIWPDWPVLMRFDFAVKNR